MPQELDDDFGSAFTEALMEPGDDPQHDDPPADAAPAGDVPADDPGSNDPADSDPAQVDDPAPDDAPDQNQNSDPSQDAHPADSATPPADAAPAGDDVEALRTKAHGYDSMFGRLNQVRQENDQLRQRLAQLEQSFQHPSQAAPQQQPQPQPQASQQAQIPEEIQEEVQAFQTRYPQFANMVTDGGEIGKSLRTLLESYGPEVAALKAENLHVQTEMQQNLNQVQQTVQQSRMEQQAEQKRTLVLGNNPELAAIADIGRDGRLYPIQGKEQDLQSYLQGVDQWVRSLPYGEAENWMRIQQSGSPAEVNQLLGAYRNSKSSQPPRPGQDSSRQAKAAAAGAVPTRRGPQLPASEPDPDDFSGAFAAALAE
jgi:hypothetical protein